MQNKQPEEKPGFKEENLAVRKKLDSIVEEDEAAVCIVAPYFPEKFSPTREIGAQIGLHEELNIERVIKELEEVDKLKLLIHSFGGKVSCSFKIANALIKNFEKIEVYVPHLALSGGTLISLVGEKIVMGEMSSLSPLDPQYSDGKSFHSVNAMLRMFEKLNEEFSKVHEKDVPYPLRAIADKFSPVELQEKVNMLEMMNKHAKEILSTHSFIGEEEANELPKKLLAEFPTHGYPITYRKAKDIFPENMIVSEKKKEKEMRIMRGWLHNHATNRGANHIIKYHNSIPKKEEKKNDRKRKKR